MARPKKAPAKAARPAGESAAVVQAPPVSVAVPLPLPGDLHRMIQTAAYFKAEADGFRMKPELYWKEAESEILARFRAPDPQ